MRKVLFATVVVVLSGAALVSLLDVGRIDVLTGLNLAMLMKLATDRNASLHDLAIAMAKCGREDIHLAGDVFRSPNNHST